MIRIALAFIATLITVTQSLLIFLKGNGVCFNNGCEVVEGLTTVSPLIFNVAGSLFFFCLFCSLIFAQKGIKLWQHTAKLLLHTALCAEAVLIFFQWQIAHTFCSYCLIIFSFIVLLNVLFGLRQTVVGFVLFLAILMSCYSLNWRSGDLEQSLDDGSVAFSEGRGDSGGGYLFFSKNCKHCEAVIELLRVENSCEIRFNPVDKISDFSFPGAEINQHYNVQVNLNLLHLLSIKEVPVFVTNTDQDVKILQGEAQIGQYLQESCRVIAHEDYSGSSKIGPVQNYISKDIGAGQDGCSVTEDCADSPGLEKKVEFGLKE